MKPAGWGTSHPGWGRCKLHGGSTPQSSLAAAREQAAASAVELGVPLDSDPHEALLAEVHRAAGMVAWLSGMVRGLDDSEVAGVLVTDVTESSDGGAVVQRRASVNVWVKLWGEERDRLTRVAKAALDAGVEERKVRLAESQAELLAGTIRAILGDLGHDLESDQVRKVVRARLMQAHPIDVEAVE